MSAIQRCWEWRVFWSTKSETPCAPTGVWPSRTAARLCRFLSRPSTLGNAKQRTDVYLNLENPNYGLKLRGTGVLGATRFELKIRKDTEGHFEDWDKCVCEDTALTPEQLDRSAIGAAVGARNAEVIEILDAAAGRATQVPIEKVRVQVDGGEIRMEAVEMSIGAGSKGLWRSVCVEGCDLSVVKLFVANPFLADIARNGMEPVEAGPFAMGYPEFISSVVLTPS